MEPGQEPDPEREEEFEDMYGEPFYCAPDAGEIDRMTPTPVGPGMIAGIDNRTGSQACIGIKKNVNFVQPYGK